MTTENLDRDIVICYSESVVKDKEVLRIVMRVSARGTDKFMYINKVCTSNKNCLDSSR